jgi:hypothetical protein
MGRRRLAAASRPLWAPNEAGLDFRSARREAVGVAALVFAGGGLLALAPFSGADRRQHDRRAFRESGRLGAELRDGDGHRLHLLAGLGEAGGKRVSDVVTE